jgi:hypothetical protein
MGTGSFPGVESGRSETLTPHPLLGPRFKKHSSAIPLLSLRAFVACRKGEINLNPTQYMSLFPINTLKAALVTLPQDIKCVLTLCYVKVVRADMKMVILGPKHVVFGVLVGKRHIFLTVIK